MACLIEDKDVCATEERGANRGVLVLYLCRYGKCLLQVSPYWEASCAALLRADRHNCIAG